MRENYSDDGHHRQLLRGVDIRDTVASQSGGRQRYVVTQRGGHQRKLLRMMVIRDKQLLSADVDPQRGGHQ